jgi:hypothetical protein
VAISRGPGLSAKCGQQGGKAEVTLAALFQKQLIEIQVKITSTQKQCKDAQGQIKTLELQQLEA